MFKHIKPLFERKRLLKIEMLEGIRDFSRDMLQILYRNYSDGILSGCRIETKGDCLRIHSGILYYNGILYIMKEAYEIPYMATGQLQYLKVRFLEEIEGVDKKEFLTQIYLDDVPPQASYELELARFKLHPGARLRDTYTDFFDFNTEFDTLIKIYVPYASPVAGSVSPEILRAYAEALMKYPVKNPWDDAFCLSCMQRAGTMGYEAVKSYLNARSLGEKKDYSVEEIYFMLETILYEVSGNLTERSDDEKNNRKMLLL